MRVVQELNETDLAGDGQGRQRDGESVMEKKRNRKCKEKYEDRRDREKVIRKATEVKEGKSRGKETDTTNDRNVKERETIKEREREKENEETERGKWRSERRGKM